MTVAILTTGLKEFTKFFENLPELATQAAYLAINDTSRDTVPLLKSKMRAQINFPKEYLNPQRLSIKRKANRANLEAVISGRDRPTSLARFAPGATRQNTTVRNKPGRPIFVTVKTGKQVKLDRSFLVKLKNGNMGLAIRLPPGQTPDRAYKPLELTRGGGRGTGAWLLYGPSVDQVMQGVLPETTGSVQDMLSKNFLRQFGRLSRG